jgi:hypothetical protein
LTASAQGGAPTNFYSLEHHRRSPVWSTSSSFHWRQTIRNMSSVDRSLNEPLLTAKPMSSLRNEFGLHGNSTSAELRPYELSNVRNSPNDSYVRPQ